MSRRPTSVLVPRMGNSRRSAATSSAGATVITLILDGDEEVAVLGLYVVLAERLDCRQPHGPAGGDVEAGAVPCALDGAVFQRARGQREVAVRAVVLERVDFAVDADEAHLDSVHVDAQQRIR